MIANNIINSAYKKAILEKFDIMLHNRSETQKDNSNKNEVITLNFNKIWSSENINIIYAKIASIVEMLTENQVI